MPQGLGPLLIVVVAAVLTAGGMVVGIEPEAALPLGDFDHAAHLERGTECSDCHGGVESHASAGVPSVQLCLSECHAEDVEEEGMLATDNGRFVLDHFKRGVEVWWPKLYTLPDHVAFSHKRHVLVGNISCETCHGDIGASTSLPYEPVEIALTMGGCIACHERNAVTTDCAACHR